MSSHLNYQRRWKLLGNKVQQLRLSISKNLFFPCMFSSRLFPRPQEDRELMPDSLLPYSTIGSS
jgi:hypothetical protein